MQDGKVGKARSAPFLPLFLRIRESDKNNVGRRNMGLTNQNHSQRSQVTRSRAWSHPLAHDKETLPPALPPQAYEHCSNASVLSCSSDTFNPTFFLLFLPHDQADDVSWVLPRWLLIHPSQALVWYFCAMIPFLLLAWVSYLHLRMPNLRHLPG